MTGAGSRGRWVWPTSGTSGTLGAGPQSTWRGCLSPTSRWARSAAEFMMPSKTRLGRVVWPRPYRVSCTTLCKPAVYPNTSGTATFRLRLSLVAPEAPRPPELGTVNGRAFDLLITGSYTVADKDTVMVPGRW